VKYSSTVEQLVVQLRSYDSDTNDDPVEEGQDAADELAGIEIRRFEISPVYCAANGESVKHKCFDMVNTARKKLLTPFPLLQLPLE
jgi:hypothetical protein